MMRVPICSAGCLSALALATRALPRSDPALRRTIRAKSPVALSMRNCESRTHSASAARSAKWMGWSGRCWVSKSFTMVRPNAVRTVLETSTTMTPAVSSGSKSISSLDTPASALAAGAAGPTRDRSRAAVAGVMPCSGGWLLVRVPLRQLDHRGRQLGRDDHVVAVADGLPGRPQVAHERVPGVRPLVELEQLAGSGRVLERDPQLDL